MIYLHLASGFEEIEAVTVVDILRRADITVQTVSMESGLDVEGAHGISVRADLLYGQADYQHCEMMIFPGGMPGAANLLQQKELMETMVEFAAKGKPVAAICAAPMLFGQMGLAVGKNVTVYPGFENQMTGAILSTEDVVVDGNLITSRGPGTAMGFALAIVERLKGEAVRNKLKGGLLTK